MGIVSKIVRQKSSWGFEAAPQNNPLLCLGSWDKCFPNTGPYHVEITLLVARPRRWHSLAAYTHPHHLHTHTAYTHPHRLHTHTAYTHPHRLHTHTAYTPTRLTHTHTAYTHPHHLHTHTAYTHPHRNTGRWGWPSRSRLCAQWRGQIKHPPRVWGQGEQEISGREDTPQGLGDFHVAGWGGWECVRVCVCVERGGDVRLQLWG